MRSILHGMDDMQCVRICGDTSRGERMFGSSAIVLPTPRQEVDPLLRDDISEEDLPLQTLRM